MSSVLLKLAQLRKSYSIHSLQLVFILLSMPVCRTILRHLESLHLVRRRNVWSCAQVHQISTSIHSCHPPIRNFTVNQLSLEGIVLEKIESLFFCQKSPLEHLLFPSDLFDLFLYFLVILVRDGIVSDERVIEEARFEGWTMTKPSSI